MLEGISKKRKEKKTAKPRVNFCHWWRRDEAQGRGETAQNSSVSCPSCLDGWTVGVGIAAGGCCTMQEREKSEKKKVSFEQGENDGMEKARSAPSLFHHCSLIMCIFFPELSPSFILFYFFNHSPSPFLLPLQFSLLSSSLTNKCTRIHQTQPPLQLHFQEYYPSKTTKTLKHCEWIKEPSADTLWAAQPLTPPAPPVARRRRRRRCDQAEAGEGRGGKLTAGRVRADKATSCQETLRRRGRCHLAVFSPSAEPRLNHKSLNHSLFSRLYFPLSLEGNSRSSCTNSQSTGSKLQGFGLHRLICPCPSIGFGVQLRGNAIPCLRNEEIMKWQTG